MIAVIKKLHRLMPAGWRRVYSPLIWKAQYVFATYLRTAWRLVLPVYVLEGTSPSGSARSFCYAGTCEYTRHYWAQRVFAGDSFRVHRLGRHPFWRVRRLVADSGLDCDLVLTETTPWLAKALARDGGFLTGRWVHLTIDTTEAPDRLWRKSDRTNDILRRLRKHDLHFETSRDPEALRDFYHNMHLPYICQRYEKEADLCDFKTAQTFLKHGELFLAVKDGVRVAGSLAEYSRRHGARLCILGIRDAKTEYLRMGVIGGLYFYALNAVRKKGYRFINIGGTRPILTDGLTNYKLSMNAEIVPRAPKLKFCLWVSWPQDSPRLRDFLVRNPFVHFPRGHRPHRALFLDADSLKDRGDFEKAYWGSHCPGVTQTDVYVYGDLTKIREWAQDLKGETPSVLPAAAALDRGSGRQVNAAILPVLAAPPLSGPDVFCSLKTSAEGILRRGIPGNGPVR